MPRSVLLSPVVLGLALLACVGCAGGDGTGDEGTGRVRYGDGPPPPAPPQAGRPSAGPSTAGPTGPSAAALAGPVVPAGAAAPCRTGALTVASGEVQAAGPDSRLLVAVTNTGNAPCSLTGHGEAGLLDAAGAPLATRTVDEGTPRTVVLAPGGSAVRELAWRTVPSGPADPAADCATGTAVRLTPPGAGPLVLEQPVTACDRGTLTGSPWGQTLDRG